MKKKLLLQMSIALIMFIPMMLVGQITDQKVNESANIETYAICLDNGLSYAQFSDQANSQQIEFKSRKGWFKSILGVVCTVVAVVDAVFGDGDLVEPLANAQCALLGSALVVDSRGGAIGSGDFPPSYMQGPAPTLESGSETYSQSLSKSIQFLLLAFLLWFNILMIIFTIILPFSFDLFNISI